MFKYILEFAWLKSAILLRRQKYVALLFGRKPKEIFLAVFRFLQVLKGDVQPLFRHEGMALEWNTLAYFLS